MNQDQKIRARYSTCTRRKFNLNLSLIALASAITGGKIMAGDPLQSSQLTLEESLEIALRAIGSDVTKAVADKLAKGVVGLPTLNVHLRNANMTAADAKLIATALDRTPIFELARLGSFSLSYNAIGDEGAKNLANSLPATLTELGLVGCSIGDRGGKAILDWAKHANGLHMICIEDNNMSDEMRKQFSSLIGMSVFV